MDSCFSCTIMENEKEREKVLKSFFIVLSDSNDWTEFSTKCTIGRKTTKPIKFEASKVWSTNHGVIGFSDIRGSYSTIDEAYKAFGEAVKEYGGAVENMTNKKLKFLESEFDYPDGRHPYLLEKAKI